MTDTTLTLVLSPAIDGANPAVIAIRDRIAKWQQLFSPGSAPYRLTGYEDLYANRPSELLAYDNYADVDSRWLGFDRYRQIWEQEINQNFPGFVMYRVEVDRIEVSGTMAWTALTWFGRVKTSAGLAWPAQHGTHAWQNIDGIWQIVHEHLTSGVKEAGQLIGTERLSATSPDSVVVHHSRQPIAA